MKKIVGLPRHQEFGGVGHAENNRSRVAQTRNQWSIGGRNIFRAETGSSFTAQTGYVDRTLDTDGNAVEWAQNLSARHRRIGRASLAANALGIDVHKRIQRRIQSLDLRQVGGAQFERRDLPLANLLRHGNRGEKREIAHGTKNPCAARLSARARSMDSFSSAVSPR